jgi:hypothetical protein
LKVAFILGFSTFATYFVFRVSSEPILRLTYYTGDVTTAAVLEPTPPERFYNPYALVGLTTLGPAAAPGDSGLFDLLSVGGSALLCGFIITDLFFI